MGNQVSFEPGLSTGYTNGTSVAPGRQKRSFKDILLFGSYNHPLPQNMSIGEALTSYGLAAGKTNTNY